MKASKVSVRQLLMVNLTRKAETVKLKVSAQNTGLSKGNSLSQSGFLFASPPLPSLPSSTP